MNKWLGLDVGTSSVKAVLITEDGQVAANARATYSTDRPTPGIAEQNPNDYVQAAADAIRSLGVDLSHVGGVGLSGHTPTGVFVDARGRPVRPAITWQDARASAESDQLAEEFGDATPLFGTSLAWSPTAMPAKLLWLHRHEPEVVKQTRWVLQPKDFVGLTLTGSPASDPWSSKGVCNVRDGTAAEEFLEHVGWSSAVCPPIAPAWASRGLLTARAADRLLLPAGIPIAVGWSDALAAMLRVNAFARPTAFILSGTSDIVGQSFWEEPPDVPGLLTIPNQCAPLPASYGPTNSSGDAVDWLGRMLGRTPPELMELQGDQPDNPPTFVPYLRGERTPLWRTDLRAAFANLSVDHGPGDLVEAVLEGISLGARQILERSEEAGGAVDEINIAGLSASVDRWTAARLRTLGRKLMLHPEVDASAVGAAALGAAAAGEQLADIVARLSRSATTAEPTAEQVQRSDRRYAEFQALSDFTLTSVSPS